MYLYLLPSPLMPPRELTNLCSQDRRKVERAKKQAKDDEWRADFQKAERKKRYIETGQAEKRKAMKADGGGKYTKKARKAEKE